MLAHEAFRQLRLSDFVGSSSIVPLEDWEFDERVWVGEALGFSEWLRPIGSPNALASLALDLATFPRDAAEKCLEVLGLDVRRGMGFVDLRQRLGEPHKTQRFVPDRLSYEFVVGGASPYRVSCTVLANGGLSYVVVSPAAAPN